jgi:hypothetical protein
MSSMYTACSREPHAPRTYGDKTGSLRETCNDFRQRLARPTANPRQWVPFFRWLKRNRRPVTQWPEQVIGRESPVRGEYLQAIRAADEGDYETWLELHRRFTASG